MSHRQCSRAHRRALAPTSAPPGACPERRAQGQSHTSARPRGTRSPSPTASRSTDVQNSLSLCVTNLTRLVPSSARLVPARGRQAGGRHRWPARVSSLHEEGAIHGVQVLQHLLLKQVGKPLDQVLEQRRIARCGRRRCYHRAARAAARGARRRRRRSRPRPWRSHLVRAALYLQCSERARWSAERRSFQEF